MKKVIEDPDASNYLNGPILINDKFKNKRIKTKKAVTITIETESKLEPPDDVCNYDTPNKSTVNFYQS